MNFVQEGKKLVYGLFSEDFYLKKQRIELVAEYAYKVKRPYKFKANELAGLTKGIESVYVVFVGLGTCFWFASGAFMLTKRIELQFRLLFLINIACNSCCDLLKVLVLYPKYENTIKGVLSNYSFQDEKSKSKL